MSESFIDSVIRDKKVDNASHCSLVLLKKSSEAGFNTIVISEIEDTNVSQMLLGCLRIEDQIVEDI